MKKSAPLDPVQLLQQAEAQLQNSLTSAPLRPLTAMQIQELIHELRIHQGCRFSAGYATLTRPT